MTPVTWLTYILYIFANLNFFNEEDFPKPLIRLGLLGAFSLEEILHCIEFAYLLDCFSALYNSSTSNTSTTTTVITISTTITTVTALISLAISMMSGPEQAFKNFLNE